MQFLRSTEGNCKKIAKTAIHFEINDMQIAEDTQLVVGHLCMQWLNSHKPNQIKPLTMAEIDFMSVLHKSTKEITWHVSTILNTPKQRLLNLAKNFRKTIGMEIDAFAMEAIAISKGAGKKSLAPSLSIILFQQSPRSWTLDVEKDFFFTTFSK